MISLLQENTVNSFYIFVGDFNFPNIVRNNISYGPSADNLLKVIFELILSQHTLQPTRAGAGKT